jgi:isoquinoline 1-oxidoreductase subunit alpha
MVRLNINGKQHEVDVDPDTPLLWVIREQVGLTGTKYGCGIAACGACTVREVKAGQKIVTIEGLSPDLTHPLQKAWLELDVPQCGYCQSGQLMAAAALIAASPKPTEDEIIAGMTNICRCGTYNRIKAAIQLAAGDVKRG